MKRVFMAAAFAAGLLLPSPAAAQSVGLAARGGSLGLGGEVNLDLNRWIGVRGGVGAIPVKPSGDIGDVKYDITPPSSLKNAGVDVYPLGGHFRVSGGLLFRHDVALDGEAAGSFEFNGVTYTVPQAGSVHGDLTWSSTSPYASFGFASRGKGLGLSLDFGAVFMGEPTLQLTARGGSMVNDPTFQSNLRAEQQKAQDDAGKYLRVLPIVSLGLRYGI